MSSDKDAEAESHAPRVPETIPRAAGRATLARSGQRYFTFPKSSRRLPWLYLIASVILAVAAGAVFSLDSSPDFGLEFLDLPGDIEKAIQLSEAFAHGMGAAVILLTVWLVAEQRRPHIWLAILMTVSSSLVANGMKAFFVRVRPHSADQVQVSEAGRALILADSETSAESAAHKTTVEASYWDSRQRSFPSGHAATATSLALGLALVFPRGTWIFAMLATLACFQRIYSGAHYPSDVLAGCAIAFVCCGLILGIQQQLRRWGWRSVAIDPDEHAGPMLG